MRKVLVVINDRNLHRIDDICAVFGCNRSHAIRVAIAFMDYALKHDKFDYYHLGKKLHDKDY